MNEKNNEHNNSSSQSGRGRGETPSSSDKNRGGIPSGTGRGDSSSENDIKDGEVSNLALDKAGERTNIGESEINFRNVLRNPLRWFGFTYFYFLVLLVTGGIFYVNNIEQISRNNITPVLIDSAIVFKDIQPVKGSISQAVDVSTIMNPEQGMVNRGKELFDITCASCHGATGQGDGIAGAALNPKPRNFHSDQGWKNGREYAGLFKTLRQGIPNSAMPAYEHIPVIDRIDIISYVRTLAKFPDVTENDINQLNTQYNIAQGDTTPSQIPVSKAIEKITGESLTTVQIVYSKISLMNNNRQESGYQILDKISSDKIKVVAYLSASGEWKNNVSAFVRSVLSSSGVNGFKPNVNSLSSEEWNELHQYLLRVLS